MRSKRGKKVFVAMSGGVDSSVAASLLVEEGHEVAGVSLRLWEGEAGPRNCSDHRGAEAVAKILGIPHTLLDLRSDFFAAVARPFARAYLEGRTPNPCISCNRDFKLGVLLDWSRAQGADYVATGHYARILHNPSGGRVALARGADPNKDQSYFLFALTQEQLARTLFPLGALTKAEVRRYADELGLPVARRPESQDVCFGDYRALVESIAVDHEASGGEIVDVDGNLLGTHRGIHGFTVGQRRGLGLSAPHRLYVLSVNPATRRVVVGKKEDLRCRGFVATSLSWIEPQEEEEFSVEVQIRYRSPSFPCTVRTDGRGSAEVRFRGSFPGVTPGQAAVFYRGERVLGGGWIERAIHV